MHKNVYKYIKIFKKKKKMSNKLMCIKKMLTNNELIYIIS